MLDVSHLPVEIAYVVEFEDAEGRVAVTACAVPTEARDVCERIERNGGRVLAKLVEHGASAAALLRAVAAVDDSKEVF